MDGSHGVEWQKLSSTTQRVIGLAVASFFNFGYGTGVISGAGPLIERDEGLSTVMEDILVVSTVVGAAAGAGTGGPLADARGRKLAIYLSALVSFVGTLWSAGATSVETIIIARALVGFGIGLSFNTVPLYAAECVSTSVRGVVVDLSDFSTVTGQLISALVNGVCASVFSDAVAWRVGLGIGCVPTLVMVIFAMSCPESPRFLATRNDNEALQVLRDLRGSQTAADEELTAIQTQVQAEKDAAWMFGSLRVRRALYLGLGLQSLNQLTGINTAMYYGGEILEDAGFGLLASIWFTAALAAIQLIGVGLSVSTIDAKGRRYTALRSLACVIPSLIGLGLAFRFNQTILVFIFLCLYLLAYGSGLSGVPYVINSEIYPVLIRGRCYSIGGALFWFENTLVSLGFPLLSQVAGPQYPFWGFAVVGIIGFYFLWYYLPETTGKPLEDIDAFFTADPYPKPWHLTGFNGLSKSPEDLNASLLPSSSRVDDASLRSWRSPGDDKHPNCDDSTVGSDSISTTAASGVV